MSRSREGRTAPKRWPEAEMTNLLEDQPCLKPVSYGVMSESLGFLLRLAQLKSFEDFYASLGSLGVKPGEISALIVIARNPGIRQGVLARALMIKRAHMTKMIRALERAGIVTRTVPADDKRSVELWLSETGKKKLGQVQMDIDAYERANTGPLNNNEKQTLTRLLRKYVALDDLAAEAR